MVEYLFYEEDDYENVIGQEKLDHTKHAFLIFVCSEYNKEAADEKEKFIADFKAEHDKVEDVDSILVLEKDWKAFEQREMVKALLDIHLPKQKLEARVKPIGPHQTLTTIIPNSKGIPHDHKYDIELDKSFDSLFEAAKDDILKGYTKDKYSKSSCFYYLWEDDQNKKTYSFEDIIPNFSGKGKISLVPNRVVHFNKPSLDDKWGFFSFRKLTEPKNDAQAWISFSKEMTKSTNRYRSCYSSFESEYLNLLTRADITGEIAINSVMFTMILGLLRGMHSKKVLTPSGAQADRSSLKMNKITVRPDIFVDPNWFCLEGKLDGNLKMGQFQNFDQLRLQAQIDNTPRVFFFGVAYTCTEFCFNIYEKKENFDSEDAAQFHTFGPWTIAKIVQNEGPNTYKNEYSKKIYEFDEENLQILFDGLVGMLAVPSFDEYDKIFKTLCKKHFFVFP